MKNNKNVKHVGDHGNAHKVEAETSKAANGHKAEAPKAAGQKAEKPAAKAEKSEAKEEDRAKSADCGCKYF